MVKVERRGADALVEALQAAGVDHVFSLSGNQIMPVFDALVGSGIRLVHVRHEAAAVFMAEGYAQATGRLGVALLTAGSGFANGLGAMVAARAAEAPMLVLTGDAPLGEAGRGAFQDLPQAAVAGHLAKASLGVRRPQDFASVVTDAAALALAGRPGPVHVSLPFDLLGQNAGPFARPAAPQAMRSSLAEGLASEIVELVRSATRPLIVGGPSLARAAHAAAVARLAGASGLPVVAMEAPRGLRDPRLGAFPEMVARADLVMLLAKPLDFMLGFGRPPAFAPDARVVMVDPEDEPVARARAAIGSRLVRSAHAGLDELLEALAGAFERTGAVSDRGWATDIATALAYRPAEWGELPLGGGLVKPAVMGREIARWMATLDDPALVIDGGEIGQWMMATLTARRRIINGPSGTIGGSLPYAIAAKAADPSHPVVAVMGDGTFGFHLGEVETAAREGLPVIAIVGNDGAWQAERQIQLRDYGADRAHGCTLLRSRYDVVASGLGGHGELVSEAAELVPALQRAYASGKPAVVNVMIEGTPAPTIVRSAQR